MEIRGGLRAFDNSQHTVLSLRDLTTKFTKSERGRSDSRGGTLVSDSVHHIVPMGILTFL